MESGMQVLITRRLLGQSPALVLHLRYRGTALYMRWRALDVLEAKNPDITHLFHGCLCLPLRDHEDPDSILRDIFSGTGLPLA